MRQLTVVVMLAVVVGFALMAVAQDTTTRLYGKVVSVDVAKSTIDVTVVNKSDTATKATITTDAKTKITLDKNAATLADIKEGMIVVATPATGTATEVRAFTPKEKTDK